MGGSRSSSRTNYGSNNYGGNRYGGNSYGGGYRSGSGMRWSSFGTGMVAYAVMSSLIRSGHGYHNGYYNGYGSYSNYRPNGQFCMNNEDFNGTKFGKFQCPLPGFDRRQTYCCGEHEYQYCCTYWDDSSRKGWTLFGIFAALAALIGTTYFIMTRVRGRNMKEEYDGPIEMPPYGQNYGLGPNYGQGPMGPRSMGPRPMGPRPMGPSYGPRPMGPNYGPRPMGPGPMGPRPMGPGPIASQRPPGYPTEIGFKQPLLPNS